MEAVIRNEEFIDNRHHYTKKEIVVALLSVFLGWFITENIIFSEKTVYFSAASGALFFLGMAVFFYKDNIKNKTTYFLFQIVAITLFSVNLIITSDIFIRNLNILTIVFASDYFVYSISSGKTKPGMYYIKDFFTALLCIPIRYISSLFVAVKSLLGELKAEKLKPVFAGLALSVPVLIFVVPLLVAADENMESLFSELTCFLVDGNKRIAFLKFLLTFAIGSKIFAVIFGNSVYDEDEEYAEDRKYISPVTVVSMVVPLCILYIVFFFSQIGYFASAFFGTLPENFSYSEYARRGFFELCFIAAINLGVIIYINFRCEKDNGKSPPVLRICIIMLSFYTEVMIATALSKMLMYIKSYGFTPLRVYPTVCIIVMAIFFIMITVKQFKESFDIRTGIVITTFTTLLLVSYGRVDAHIARFNILLYDHGVTEELDMDLLYELSDDAIPYIHKLAMSDSVYSEEAKEMLISRAIKPHEFNFSEYRAEKILEKYKS